MTAGRLPNFLIAGVPKAGTTSMAAYLGEHPSVFMSATKELHFFDSNFERGVDWYAQHFAHADGATIVGEATPTYAVQPRAVERMAGLLPQARLLVMLRDPVDRAYSLYWWQEQYERPPFAEAVRAEMRGDELNGRRTTYLAQGRYSEHLTRLLERYPRSAVHVALLEELSADPRAVFAGVCRFLDIDDAFVPAALGTVLNPAFRYRRPWVTAALLRMRAWRWMPFGLAARIERGNRVRNDYPPMDPAVRAELREFFAEDASRLADLLGRDVAAAWR